jgi:hypothetical protein
MSHVACFARCATHLQECAQRVVDVCRAKDVIPGNFALTEQKAQVSGHQQLASFCCCFWQSLKTHGRCPALCKLPCLMAAAGLPVLWLCVLQDLLGQGFTLLATGTDVGLMGEAAAKNAAFAAKLRQQQP